MSSQSTYINLELVNDKIRSMNLRVHNEFFPRIIVPPEEGKGLVRALVEIVKKSMETTKIRDRVKDAIEEDYPKAI